MTDKQPPKQSLQAAQSEALSYFQSQGWSREQAAGIVGNLEAESSLNPRAFNPDGGGQGAKGIAQWRGSRLKDFEAFAGKGIDQSTREEQMAFVHHELTAGKETAAGRALKAATTADGAADVIVRKYERPGNLDVESSARGNRALRLLGVATVASPTKPGTVTITDETGAMTKQQREATGDARALAVANSMFNIQTKLASDTDVKAQEVVARETGEAAKLAEDGKTGYTDAVGTAWQDPRNVPTRTILEAAFVATDGVDDAVPKDWSYFNNREKLESGLRSQDEVDYMRENGMESPAAYDRALGELHNRRGYDAEYAKVGVGTAFAAQLTAGLADPVSLLAGLGLSKAFQIARLGSGAFIAAGQGRAALGAAAAENALGNLAIEAAADVAGDVKSASDYALATATGAGMSALFARGTFRAAAAAEEANILNTMKDKAIAEHAQVVQSVKDELGPDATLEQIQDAVATRQVKQINDDLDTASNNTTYAEDNVIDKQTVQMMKDDFEGKVADDVNAVEDITAEKAQGVEEVKADAEPDDPPPVSTDNPDAVADALKTVSDEAETAPVVTTTKEANGDALTVSWKFTKKPKGEGRTVKDVLAALAKFPSKTNLTLKPIVDRLLAVVDGVEGSKTDVDFALTYKRGWYHPAGSKGPKPVITAPADVSGTYNLNAITANLSDHSQYTIVHEIVHALTHSKIQRVLNGTSTNPREIEIVQGLQNMRGAYIKSLQKNGAPAKPTKAQVEGDEDLYAAQDLHEFVAQVYSSRKVQETLGSMVVTKGGRGTWHKFINSIAELLGLKGNTELDFALDAVDSLIRLDTKSDKKLPLLKEELLSKSASFAKWFGDSKMFDVLADGTKVPRILYHGTAAKFSVFQPKQAGAIFATPHAAFAKAFEDLGWGWVNNANNWDKLAKQLGMTRGAFDKRVDEVGFKQFLKEVEYEKRTYPLFVRAVRTWDYTNADDRGWLAMKAAQRARDVEAGLRTKLGLTPWTPFEAADYMAQRYNSLEKALVKGDWHAIEEYADLIKAEGFDSFTMRETQGGVNSTNTAVFDSNQLKHAFDNNGDFSMSDNDIYKAQPKAALAAQGTSSNKAQTGAAIWLPKIIQHARDWTTRNPVDQRKLATLTRAIGKEGTLGGGYSDGLKLAGSGSPIMRLVAGLVIETTTGAAGRRGTAAVAREILHRKFIGNTILDYNGGYAAYARAKGVGATKQYLNDVNEGSLKREFDDLVYREILNRRNKLPLSKDPNVKGAADSMEAGFTKMLNEQKTAGVLGGDNLPGDSVGYIPQALDGQKLAVATEPQLRALEANLKDQFLQNTDWDDKFADTFAKYYVKRARDRAMNAKGIDGQAASSDGLAHIHELLTELGDDVPALKDAANKAKALMLAKSGIGQTKKRLEIDLTARLPDGTEVMDFYKTDPLLLYRQYANRTAGNVALTRYGVLGPKGVRQLREAAQALGGAERATKDELDAFDRVMAEMMGQPDPGGVVSAGATNLRLLVSLQRLGGLAFTQAAETFNAVHHLGLGAVMKGIPDLPRLLGEVRSIKSGRVVKSQLLGSMETYSGAEFGAENYKMVAPLDAPDNRLVEYGDTAGLGSRLLNSGVHLQSKVSFFRGLMAAQHRMMAEQIVLKSIRYIETGSGPKALADMGFTDRVVQGMKADLAQAVTYGPDGRVKEFDITKIQDPRVREEFIQSVHRGVSQIIQGTFVGERSAWASNDYAKLFLQLRTFGLTAVEKQWGRTRMNEGYAKASGLLLGQMALALPIHLARIQLGAAGREDRDEYIERNTSPGGLVRALMNYSSLSGLSGDILELTTSVAGGWATLADKQGGKEFKEFMGAGQQSASVGRSIPVAGTVDSAIKVLSGKADLHTALKQLPGSNLPFMIPVINLTK